MHDGVRWVVRSVAGLGVGARTAPAAATAAAPAGLGLVLVLAVGGVLLGLLRLGLLVLLLVLVLALGGLAGLAFGRLTTLGGLLVLGLLGLGLLGGRLVVGALLAAPAPAAAAAAAAPAGRAVVGLVLVRGSVVEVVVAGVALGRLGGLGGSVSAGLRRAGLSAVGCGGWKTTMGGWNVTPGTPTPLAGSVSDTCSADAESSAGSVPATGTDGTCGTAGTPGASEAADAAERRRVRVRGAGASLAGSSPAPSGPASGVVSAPVMGSGASAAFALRVRVRVLVVRFGGSEASAAGTASAADASAAGGAASTSGGGPAGRLARRGRDVTPEASGCAASALSFSTFSLPVPSAVAESASFSSIRAISRQAPGRVRPPRPGADRCGAPHESTSSIVGVATAGQCPVMTTKSSGVRPPYPAGPVPCCHGFGPTVRR
ncbi:hypothetical protein [Actinomadura madurae]|uniref:hypothetical protein n=1 Tax=Actinomadura madurae TaxID=1993 RepID=UPI0027E39E4B|nr:hypothetical protein [Actinomadura madurae]